MSDEEDREHSQALLALQTEREALAQQLRDAKLRVKEVDAARVDAERITQALQAELATVNLCINRLSLMKADTPAHNFRGAHDHEAQSILVRKIASQKVTMESSVRGGPVGVSKSWTSQTTSTGFVFGIQLAMATYMGCALPGIARQRR